MSKIPWKTIESKIVEYAKSGRSACKGCSEQIEKDEMRIGLGAYSFGDSLSYRYFHPQCLTFNPHITNIKDLEGHDDLSAADQKKLEKLIKGSESGPRKKTKRKAESDEDNDNNHDEDSEKEEKKKKKKTRKLTAKEKKEQAAIETAKEELSSKSINELKDILRANKQPVSGTKSTLVDRVAFGRVKGAIPRCPKCHGGYLTYQPESGLYTCKGFMEDDKYRFCKYKSADVELEKWAEE